MILEFKLSHLRKKSIEHNLAARDMTNREIVCSLNMGMGTYAQVATSDHDFHPPMDGTVNHCDKIIGATAALTNKRYFASHKPSASCLVVP